MIFEETGRLSRAWWLEMVKKFGDTPGMKFTISDEKGVTFAMVKEAVDQLVMNGYIEMKGNGGRNGYTYLLTTQGHRYINEHRDQLSPLIAVESTAPPSEDEHREPVKHSVGPPAPVFAGAPEVKHMVTPLPSVREHLEEPSELVPNPNLNPYGPPKLDLQPAPSIHDRAMEAMHTLLYDRFADQITAKELIEKMGNL